MTTINEINNGKQYNSLEVVGYVGCLGSGKSTRANKLIDEGFMPVGFADELRSMAWKLLSWHPISDEQYEEFKKGDRFIDSMAGFINGRLFLQNLGETMREDNKNYWVDKLKQRIDKLYKMGYTKIVITDVRHENELEMIKSYNNSKVVFCDYKSDRYDCKNKHISEKLAQDYLKLNYKDGDLI